MIYILSINFRLIIYPSLSFYRKNQTQNSNPWLCLFFYYPKLNHKFLSCVCCFETSNVFITSVIVQTKSDECYFTLHPSFYFLLLLFHFHPFSSFYVEKNELSSCRCCLVLHKITCPSQENTVIFSFQSISAFSLNKSSTSIEFFSFCCTGPSFRAKTKESELL